MTCTNLADVLWNKRDLPGAAQLYRRALAIDASLYGRDRPETAADIANLGMLLKEASQASAADELLHQALDIYERPSDLTALRPTLSARIRPRPPMRDFGRGGRNPRCRRAFIFSAPSPASKREHQLEISEVAVLRCE